MKFVCIFIIQTLRTFFLDSSKNIYYFIFQPSARTKQKIKKKLWNKLKCLKSRDKNSKTQLVGLFNTGKQSHLWDNRGYYSIGACEIIPQDKNPALSLAHRTSPSDFYVLRFPLMSKGSMRKAPSLLLLVPSWRCTCLSPLPEIFPFSSCAICTGLSRFSEVYFLHEVFPDSFQPVLETFLLLPPQCLAHSEDH